MPATRRNSIKGAERELRIAQLEQEIAKTTAKVAAAGDPVERAQANLDLVKLRHELVTQKRRRARHGPGAQNPLPFQGQKPPQPCPNCERLERELRLLRGQSANTGPVMFDKVAKNPKPPEPEQRSPSTGFLVGYVEPLPYEGPPSRRKVVVPGVAVAPEETYSEGEIAREEARMAAERRRGR